MFAETYVYSILRTRNVTGDRGSFSMICCCWCVCVCVCACFPSFTYIYSQLTRTVLTPPFFSRQSDVVDHVNSMFRGDRLCLKAALPNQTHHSTRTGRQASRQRDGSGGDGLERQANFVEQTRDWSPGFSLDAVNIDQSLTLPSWIEGGGRKHRHFELGFVSRLAPGKLGQAGTKVVYFFPRLVVVNLLERPIAVAQPEKRSWRRGSGDNRAVQVAPSEWAPFQLPFAYSKRHVYVDLGPAFKPSAKLPLDMIGEYTISLRHEELIKASDRAQIESEYTIHYPFGGSAGSGRNLDASSVKKAASDGIGLFLETDVAHDCIVVKRVKPDSYAALHEDVRPGDQLLNVAGLQPSNRRTLCIADFDKMHKFLQRRVGEIRAWAVANGGASGGGGGAWNDASRGLQLFMLTSEGRVEHERERVSALRRGVVPAAVQYTHTQAFAASTPQAYTEATFPLPGSSEAAALREPARVTMRPLLKRNRSRSVLSFFGSGGAASGAMGADGDGKDGRQRSGSSGSGAVSSEAANGAPQMAPEGARLFGRQRSTSEVSLVGSASFLSPGAPRHSMDAGGHWKGRMGQGGGSNEREGHESSALGPVPTPPLGLGARQASALSSSSVGGASHGTGSHGKAPKAPRREGSAGVAFAEGTAAPPSALEVLAAAGSRGELPTLEAMVNAVGDEARADAARWHRDASASAAREERAAPPLPVLAIGGLADRPAVDGDGDKHVEVGAAEDFHVRVDLRAQGASFLMVIRPVTEANPVLYRVKNETCHHTLCFRQSDCDEYVLRGHTIVSSWKAPRRQRPFIIRLCP